MDAETKKELIAVNQKVSELCDLVKEQGEIIDKLLLKQAKKPEIECPDCKGTGDLSGKSQNCYEECGLCHGLGTI